MKKMVVLAGLVLLAATVPAGATTVDWKGVTWEVANGTAMVNLDGSLTLTITGNGTASLHANRLEEDFETVMDPWVKWAFEGHKGDILIEQESPPGPTIQAGSIWGGPYEVAIARYTASDGARLEEFFIGAADAEPISHVLDLGKRPDGTVDGRFDSDPWAESTFLKTNVGGDWGFNDVYLRLREGTAGDTIVFSDFQYGSGHGSVAGAVPEPMTMACLFMGVTGLAGYIRKRRMA